MVRRVLLGIVFFGLACGGGGFDEDDADESFRAIDGALLPAVLQAQLENSALGEHAVSLSRNCDTGTVEITGTLTRIDRGLTEDYSVQYTACEKDGVIIDGNLQYDRESAADEPSPKSWTGTVTLSGGVDSEVCTIDFVVTASAGAACTFSYAGTLCGFGGREPLGTICTL